MNRIIAIAALVAATSAGAQSHMPPPATQQAPINPTLEFGDGRGAKVVTINFDGVTLHGSSLLTFGAPLTSSMAMPIGGQAGWAAVRVEGRPEIFWLPIFHSFPLK